MRAPKGKVMPLSATHRPCLRGIVPRKVINGPLSPPDAPKFARIPATLILPEPRASMHFEILRVS